MEFAKNVLKKRNGAGWFNMNDIPKIIQMLIFNVVGAIGFILSFDVEFTTFEDNAIMLLSVIVIQQANK